MADDILLIDARACGSFFFVALCLDTVRTGGGYLVSGNSLGDEGREENIVAGLEAEETPAADFVMAGDLYFIGDFD